MVKNGYILLRFDRMYERDGQTDGHRMTDKANNKLCCIASIQNVERSLLLLVVSASDIPLRTIKFYSLLFSSAYRSMLQSVTNNHSLVRRGLCDLHCMVVGNCFCHFVVRTYASSNRSIASGAWPTVSYTQLRRR